MFVSCHFINLNNNFTSFDWETASNLKNKAELFFPVGFFCSLLARTANNLRLFKANAQDALVAGDAVQSFLLDIVQATSHDEDQGKQLMSCFDTIASTSSPLSDLTSAVSPATNSIQPPSAVCDLMPADSMQSLSPAPSSTPES
uniref:Uncharacterized protein n=1 Tax=Panagrolaimus davidi TaxID=227884 RepID=A0A914QNW9_9BILA